MNIATIPWKKTALILIGVNLILAMSITGLGVFLYNKGVEIGTLKGTISSLEADSKRKDILLGAVASLKVSGQPMFDFTSKQQ